VKVFGFYKADRGSVDLSMIPFLPEAEKVVLFGGGLMVLKRALGIIHGFSGFASLYLQPKEKDGRAWIETEGPLFISEGGFFSDDPAALVGVGVELDLKACKEFVEKGDDGKLVPLKGTIRYGGTVRIQFGVEGMDMKVVGKGNIPVHPVRGIGNGYDVIPELLGSFWRVKLITTRGGKRRRLFTVERWAKGFLGLV